MGMVSAVLQGSPALVPVFLVLALLLGAAARPLARRHRLPLWATVSFGVALAGELTATFFPTGNGGSREPACTRGADLAFTLGTTQGQLNLALYVPLALFAVLAFGRPAVVAVSVLALTAVTETVQGLLPAIGRACDTGDLAANALGGLLGVLLGCAVRLAQRRRIRPGGRELLFGAALGAAVAVPVLALQTAVLAPAAATGTSSATEAQQQLALREAELLLGPGAKAVNIQRFLGGPGIEQVIVTTEDATFTVEWPSGRLLDGMRVPDGGVDSSAQPVTEQQARTVADRFVAQWYQGRGAGTEPVLDTGTGGDTRRFTYSYPGGSVHVDVQRTGRVVQFGRG